MADIEEIRRKIDQLISEKGLNYRDVSLKIGRKDSYMQQYVKYGYPRRLKEIDRMRLAKLLNVDDAEIMDEEVIASKTLNTSSPNILHDIITANSSTESGLAALDVLDAQLSDKGFLKKTIGKYFISKHILEDMTNIKPKNIKIVKVINDSMKPTINSGDIIWFDATYQVPEADGLYLLATGRELTIKRVQTSPLDGTIEIRSDNPNYKTYYATKPTDVKVLGKIIYLSQKI